MWMTFVHLDGSSQTFLTDLPKMNMNFFSINYQMQVMIFTLFIAFWYGRPKKTKNKKELAVMLALLKVW